MGSTRLPGKVLKILAGDTTLARVVSRLRRSRLLDAVLIAATTASMDEDIVHECNRIGVEVFRGDEEDVLDRYYNAARSVHADVVVRITSDCPLIDPAVTDQTVEGFLRERPDYASNVLERTYPRGLDTEVMTLGALERGWREAREGYQREHVTPYLYENPKIFKLLSVKGEVDYSYHRWTLDTQEDLQFLQAVYDRFDGRDDFTWREVLELVEREAGLAAINSKVAQKALRKG
jgi:spore coat polysaccharide biosynthesis protein SpsF